MQKAEYRYYEISQDLPVMALSGKKWEIIYEIICWIAIRI